MSYKFNFLWPYEAGSIAEAIYETANGRTSSYQKMWADILLKRISQQNVQEADKGLKIWQEWFEWSGDPWQNDDYGNTFCFFCGEGIPNHLESCAFVKAQELILAQ